MKRHRRLLLVVDRARSGALQVALVGLGVTNLVCLANTEAVDEEGSSLLQGEPGALGVGEVDEDEGQLRLVKIESVLGSGEYADD
jgi:hypothetical protein